ncbi:MAG: twin-arginine translocase TatA/TatE family subunit [Rubrobacteraceae bacterium]
MPFGLLEFGIVLFIVLLILGPKRIQGLLAAMGRGVRDFTSELGRDKKQKQLPEEDPEADKDPRKK